MGLNDRQPQFELSANPAAGAEFSVTVPAGEVWEILSVSVPLVQAAAGSSQPSLQIDDGGSNIFALLAGSTAAQAISTTCQYTWAPDLELTGQVGATTAVRSQGSLPSDLVIGPGCRVRSSTVGLSASTDYGAAVIRVRKRTGAAFPA